MSANLDVARTNMVLNQLKCGDVLDPGTLDLLSRVPRERFVPQKYVDLAFADEMLPLGHGQVMFPPLYEGRFLQALAVKPGDRVLDVGTGSGYFAALLARASGAEVVSVDIFPDFVRAAEERLRDNGVQNVRLETGDASRDWPDGGPFDVVMISAGLPWLPPEWVDRLALGGRMGVIVGQSPAMTAQVMVRGEAGVRTEWLFETDVPELLNAPRDQAFEF